MKRICLINICIRPDAKTRIVPVGLSYVATAIKKAGIKFDLIDMDINGYSTEDVAKIIKAKGGYDIFLFGCIVSGFKYAKELSDTLRRVCPNSIIIAGNSVADAIPEITLNRLNIDICTMGEGDFTTPELLNALENGDDLRKVKGIAFKDKKTGEIIKTEPRPFSKNMDDYGFPDWDIFELDKYAEFFSKASFVETGTNDVTFPLTTSRGCPFACTFCYIVVRNQKIRYRAYSEESIKNEIIRLHDKYGVTVVSFWDDNSFPSQAHLIKRLETIESLPFKIKWDCICRTGLFHNGDDELIQRMSRAGCMNAEFSLESADDEILKAIDKRIKVEDFIEQCHVLAKNGVRPLTSIIFGYPQETKDTIKKTLDVCYEAGVYPSSGFLLPLPGTPIYKWCIDNGYIKDEYEFLMSLGDRQDFHINLTKMSDKELIEAVKDGLKELARKQEINVQNVLKTVNYQAPKLVKNNKQDVFPEVIRFETSAVCNFNCRHCCNGILPSSAKRQGFASNELFDELLHQFKDNNYKPRVMVFYHGGEPLLNKNTPDLIKKAKSFGIKKTKIVTNGSLLTDEVAQKLIDSGLNELEVSFDGISPSENDYIRRNANFSRDSKNILNLLKKIKEQNADLSVGISNVQILKEGDYKRNKPIEVPQYLKDCFKEYMDNITIKSFPAMVWPDFDKTKSEFRSIMLDENPVKYCPVLFEYYTILANGDVALCCYDIKGKNIFGNILKQSIFDIWNNEKFVNYRNNIKNGNPDEFCKNCLIFKKEYLLYK